MLLLSLLLLLYNFTPKRTHNQRTSHVQWSGISLAYRKSDRPQLRRQKALQAPSIGSWRDPMIFMREMVALIGKQ